MTSSRALVGSDIAADSAGLSGSFLVNGPSILVK